MKADRVGGGSKEAVMLFLPAPASLEIGSGIGFRMGLLSRMEGR